MIRFHLRSLAHATRSQRNAFLAQHPVADLVAKTEIRERLGSRHTR